MNPPQARFDALRRLWIPLGCALMVSLTLACGQAPKPAEKPLFDAALSALQDGFYRRAEQDFTEFLQQFPQSEKAGEATLLQLHARAEALLKEESYKEAAAVFERLVQSDPSSPRRLDAVLGLAWSLHRQGDSRKAFDLLSKPENGLIAPDNAPVAADARLARGLLSLAEVALSLNEPKAAEGALARLGSQEFTPMIGWQRRFLTVRLHLAKGDPRAAMDSSTNLIALSKTLPGGRSLGESALLRAEVLLKNNNPTEALSALEQNFVTNVPLSYRKTAMIRGADLLKAQFKPEDAVGRLETILKSAPAEGVADLAELALGELFMRRFYGLAENLRASEGTNHLASARAHLDLLVLRQPASELRPMAHYHLGWSWWEDNVLQPSPARALGAETNFDAASRLLPRSESQMIARFKLADALLLRGDFLSAITNYSAVLTNYAEWKNSKLAPHDQALYQLVRAWVGRRDLSQARETSKRLNQEFPGSAFGERSLLLVAQEMNRQSPPAEARALFEQMVQSYPGSPSVPDAQLGIARSFEREDRWTNAVEAYRSWLGVYTNHAARAAVEYFHAAATARSGAVTNAFPLFTNFLYRNTAHEFAPKAQNWIADYYFERGEYVPAEENYQRLYSNTNWTELEIMYRARYWAARASFLRQGFPQARAQLTALINLLNASGTSTTNQPPNLLEEAWYLLGDTLSTEADQGRSAGGLQEAINAFSRIPATNYLAPRAWGRIAGCHMALATGAGNVLITNRFGEAAEFFKKAVQAPHADIATRSLAELGLGQALQELSQAVEKRDRDRLLREALGHYLQVFYEKNRQEGEAPYPYAMAQCGIAAVNTAEALGRFTEAANLARRLVSLFPALKTRYSERLKLLDQQAAGEKG